MYTTLDEGFPAVQYLRRDRYLDEVLDKTCVARSPLLRGRKYKYNKRGSIIPFLLRSALIHESKLKPD